MAHIDLVALQQRLAQQQPKPAPPVPAEPPAWRTRAAPAGTLRATTTMRAALPLKATNARAERAEERAMVKALRAQMDELEAEIVAARAEAERALAEERQRADRLNKQVEAVVGRAERAEADRDAECAEAAALRTSIDELKAGQAVTMDMHARELAVARAAAQEAQDAAEALRREKADRKARGLMARLTAVWRGE